VGLLRTEFKPSMVQYFWYAKMKVFLASSLLNVWWHIPRDTTIYANSHELALKNTRENLQCLQLTATIQFNFLSICQTLISTFPTQQATKILPQLRRCLP